MYRKIIGVLEMGALSQKPCSFIKKLMDVQIAPDLVSDSILIDLYSEVEGRGECYLLDESRKMTDSDFSRLLYAHQQSRIDFYKNPNSSTWTKLLDVISNSVNSTNITIDNKLNSRIADQGNNISDISQSDNISSNDFNNGSPQQKKRVRFNDAPNIVSIPARGDTQLNQERDDTIIVPAPGDERDGSNTVVSSMSTMVFNGVGDFTMRNLF